MLLRNKALLTSLLAQLYAKCLAPACLPYHRHLAGSTLLLLSLPHQAMTLVKALDTVCVRAEGAKRLSRVIVVNALQIGSPESDQQGQHGNFY